MDLDRSMDNLDGCYWISTIVVFFVGRKWKNVDNDDDDEEAQQA